MQIIFTLVSLIAGIIFIFAAWRILRAFFNPKSQIDDMREMVQGLTEVAEDLREEMLVECAHCGAKRISPSKPCPACGSRE